jgi:paraquat-inducible protein B
MTDPERPPSGTPPPAAPPSIAAPTPRTRRWRGPSLVWLVPVIALVVGASLAIKSVMETGPRVTIDFDSADGLRPGRTEVRYKEVVVGRVDGVSLTEDRKRVRVSVQLARSVSNIAVEDTRFWVVKPRVDTAGISGLETLVSGAYIGVDAGISDNERDHFDGLEAPPFVLRGEPGRSFVLRTRDLGSLDVGSPILYRRTRVGRVVGYKLDPVQDELLVQIFIESPYERLVNSQARFWNVSGIDLTLNANGLSLNTQTLASVIAGGISFERPPGTQALQAAPDGQRFELFPDRKNALAPPDGTPLPVRMVFDQSVRGLAVGAPIDFLGLEIGSVKSIRLLYDRKRHRYPIEVMAELYPLRLGDVRETVANTGAPDDVRDRALLERMIGNGLSAQARTGNLLTGQMYVALDFTAKSGPPAEPGDATLEVPTVRGTLSEVQPQIAEIIAKINKVPFDDIGRDVRQTLSQAQTAIGKLTPEAQRSLAEVNKTLGGVQESLGRIDRNLLDPSAPVQRNVEDTMRELQRAAQSLRVLTDYLQRHPESLLRGKPEDAKLPSETGSLR